MADIVNGRLVRSNESQHFVGTDDEGNRYYADIALDKVDEQKTFTDHSTGVLVWELAICGSIFERNRYKEPVACGQCVDEFRKVTKPADGWTLADIDELVRMWEAWHLNGMHPWCEHQRPRAKAVDFDYDQLKGLVCAEGPEPYKYGSAWLARQIPEDDIAEIQRLMALPAGNIPRCIRKDES